MDPEVRQNTPGACPKCGMALEPDIPAAPVTRVEYTCPMHPEIVRDAPGACPICGMALEIRTIAMEEPANPELADMTRRTWLAALLGLPVFLLAMGDMVLGMGLGGRIDMRLSNWVGGSGTDVAMESAGITLVKGDLRGLVRARRLSRATMKNIRQNLFLAFIYNAVGVPVAAGVLYPLVGVLISPIWASAAMTFSSVSVIANALRLRRLEL